MGKFSFLLKTAYRDSRQQRGKLFMFMSSIILGIMALVAINSFNDNLVRDIDDQTKSILGADIQVEGRAPLTEELAAILDSVPAERASELDFFSMAYLPKNDETQFVRIKAIEGDFPFYGKLITVPESAAMAYQQEGTMLVDETLMLEYGLEVGDSLKLGNKYFNISGRLKNAFGSISMGTSFAPTIYIDRSQIEATELLRTGSIVEHRYYLKTPPEFDDENWDNNRERMKPFRAADFNVTTIVDQKRRMNRAFDFLNTFLNLVALVALLLGCIGVASSVFIYIKSKIPSIAVLRCVGMRSEDSFFIYFVQILSLGFIGVVIGCVLGSLIQIALPILLKDVLPYQVDLMISWPAIFQGLIVGTLITMLFALIPLLSVRRISPLRVLRVGYEDDVSQRDHLKAFVYLMIVLALVIFLYTLTGSWRTAFLFTIGLLVSFLVLYGMAYVLVRSVKRFFPRKASFALRQGVANLYRPNNQTTTLVVSIGLGTMILTLLFVIQGLILSNVNSMDAGNQPNMILYGIETSQKDSLARITESMDMPVVQQVPIVTMKLAGWKGKTKAEWMRDTTRRAERWVMRREARVTYRDTLEFDEELVKGEYTGRVEDGDSILISLDAGWAESLDVDIGDEIVWNVQGAMLTTYVSSLRNIEFRSMRTRFFILFPLGVLEQAPQFHVLVTKSPDNNTMADYRRRVVKTFPNISVVDLGSILTTLNDILSKISYVVKFMAAFSILTGLIVLISSLLLSKFQRVRESVLLRTIGARSAQILKINAAEYAVLGIISASMGIFLALIGSYLIATSEMDLEFDIAWWPILFVFFVIVGLTVAIGLFNTRDILKRSPLEVLRKEVG